MDTSVDSLRKLHRKIKTVDAQLEERGDLSTIRSAWGEVVDNVDRGTLVSRYAARAITSETTPSALEAQARQALCATLSTDVIVPLTSLKVRSSSLFVPPPLNQHATP